MIGSLSATLVGLRPYKFQDRRTQREVSGVTAVLLAKDGTGDTLELGVPKDQAEALVAELTEAEGHQLPVVVHIEIRQSREDNGNGGSRKVTRVRATDFSLV